MARTISLQTVMSEFDDMVQQELQNHEALQGTCRTFDTEGDSFNIPFFDQLEMTKADFSAGNIPAVNVDQRNVAVVQENFNLKTVIGKAYQTLFNYDVIQGHVRQHANAMGRFNDSLKLKALLAADGEFIAGNNNVVAATGGFKVATLNDAKFKIMQNGGELMNNSAWVSSLNGPSFYNDPNFISWDQNSNRPLMHGSSIGMYNGVDVRVLGEASPGSNLPSNAGKTSSTAYMVGYEALAVAYNRRPSSRVTDEENEDRVCVLSVSTAGAKVTLSKSIVRIDVTVNTPV